MTRLVDDLLDVSRITRGKIELRPERVTLAEVVEAAAEASRPLVHERQQTLTIAVPAEPIYLDIDPARIAQVLSNLLNNAAKFTPEHGQIWVSGELVGAQVELRVRDTGVGLTAEMLPRIFDMFTQVDSSLERSQAGLGLGLTLVQSLVALHGGMVRAQSGGPEQGSEFIVTLPVAGAAAPTRTSPRTDLEKTAPMRNFRILVVDDNKDAADSLAKLLRMVGHELRTAYDGMEALNAAAAFLPDVVILDIGLPKLNGYDVARRLKSERGPSAILIAVTGWGQESDRRRSSEAGFDHHVTKPVKFADLKSLLASLDLPTP
jgi:CheY-like chemotaxis protein